MGDWVDPFYALREEKKFAVSRFPLPYASATWDDVPMSARAERRIVIDWVDQWRGPDTRPTKGLMLLGEPGRGKTLLATLALKDVMLAKRRRGAFIASADLISQSMASMTPGRVEEEDVDFMDNCFDPNYIKCLVLDDVSKEHRGASEWAQHEIDRLIRKRYMGNGCTIVTTNLPVPGWGKIYGPSMESFIHQAFEIIPLGGPDARR